MSESAIFKAAVKLAPERRAAYLDQTCGPNPDLRAQSVLTLAEFTDVEEVIRMLGPVALDDSEPLDLRYSAYMSLERAGQRPECVDILRQLALDETFGRSAHSLLSIWNLQ